MSENICSSHDCKLEVYKDSDKCVLHCEKSSDFKYNKDDFNEKLIQYIVIQILKMNNDEHYIDEESAIEFLNGKSIKELSDDEFMQDSMENVLSSMINFASVFFPLRSYKDSNDYQLILQRLKAIQFHVCTFWTDNLELPNLTCFFSDCTFKEEWRCEPYLQWERKYSIYHRCTFEKKITNYNSIDANESIATYNTELFALCNFTDINFENVLFKEKLFYKIHPKHKNFSISFKNCIFQKPFKLNNCQIDNFICNDTVFKNKSKFEFKNNIVESFKIKNTNFKALVDCFQTEFKTFKVEKSIFEKFTGFEQCQFGEDNKKEKKKAEFEYATFLDFVNFREAKFHDGLDLQNANLKEYPNFLDVYVEPKNTNRETFRIIKHSFDKVGNIIEANKFFAYEMNKEREVVSIKEDFNKKTILNLNYWISNFGQSWVKPFVLILFVAMFHTLLIYAIDSKFFQCIDASNSIYSVLKWIVEFSNDMAKNILPFKKILVKNEGIEFINLIFLIFYSTLIYNLIIAVKRMTKR